MYEVKGTAGTVTMITPMRFQFHVGPSIIHNNKVPKPNLNVFKSTE